MVKSSNQIPWHGIRCEALYRVLSKSYQVAQRCLDSSATKYY